MPRNAGLTAGDGGAVMEKTARSPNDADNVVGHHVDRHFALLAVPALTWIKTVARSTARHITSAFIPVEITPGACADRMEARPDPRRDQGHAVLGDE